MALIPHSGRRLDLWWKLSAIITCGTLAGAIIPELVKIFTSTESAHVAEVVTSSREGGASLNILSGLVAGNFSAFWMGIVLIFLMGTAWLVSTQGFGELMTLNGFDTSPVFAFGLVAFGFLGMGPVTIAVDSYGPVTDNAQSVYELSMIEQMPGVREEIQTGYGFDVQFDRAKHNLEANDGAGNTFKATAKPVLIGTAVVGATTMIFSIIVLLTHGLDPTRIKFLSLLHPPFLLGLIAGGSVIYWFTGASIQAVVTGAYRAVEFIKANIRLEGVEKASIADSKKVVEICTIYAQKGMFNIFLTVFFGTLAFACVESFFFIGYLIVDRAVRSLPGAVHGERRRRLGQREEDRRGGAEGEGDGAARGDRGRRHGRRPVQGHLLGGDEPDHQVHDALRPAGRRAGGADVPGQTRLIAAIIFFAIALYFVYRSFYGMRIEAAAVPVAAPSRSA